ncbi:beta-1,4-galactosyltransferase 1-like, partial [Tachysurus ichikawai]
MQCNHCSNDKRKQQVEFESQVLGKGIPLRARSRAVLLGNSVLMEFNVTFPKLNRTSTLLFAVCILHLSVVIIFYLRNFRTIHMPVASQYVTSSGVPATTEVGTESIQHCPETPPHL